MSDLSVLLVKRAEISTKMDEIEAAAAKSESQQFTDEQRASYDQELEHLAQVNQDIERMTKRMEAENASVKRDRGIVKTSGHWEGEAEKKEQLAQFSSLNAPPTPYVGVDLWAPTEAKRERMRAATAFGQQLIDVYKAHTGQGVSDSLRTIQAAAQGAGENVGADGGFLVQTDVGGMLMREIMSDDVFLGRVRNIPLSPQSNGITFHAVDETSRATGSRWGGVQGYWVDEGTAPTATQPAFRKIELKVNKVAALGYATDELIQDATAIGTIMFDAFVEELRWLVSNAIMNGTGAGQPDGILSAPALVSVTRATASEVNQADITGVWARLHARSRANSVWFINQDVNPELDTMFVAGASSDLSPRFITYGPEGTVRMKGKPVIESEFQATMGTVGDVVLADMSQYLFAAKAMQQASSMHVRFTTDEMAFRVTWRVDGRPAWISALTPANGTNTLSPFVTIAT